MATTIVTKKGSGAPAASDLVEGELAVDTTNGRLYTENSSAAVVELGSNPSGNITFGDNGKAIFGAGSDATLHSDGSAGYARGFVLQNTAGDKDVLSFVDGGAATLFHNNAAKIATTATGTDITGTATATSFASTAGGTFTTAAGNDLNIVYPDSRSLFIKEGSATHVTVDNAGKVGIGVTPATPLNVAKTGDGTIVRLLSVGIGEWDFSMGNSSTLTGVGAGALELLPLNSGTGSEFAIGLAGSSTPVLHVKSGNVGIGCTPSNKLDIKGTVGFEATNSTNKWLAYHYTDNTLRFNYNGAGADELVIDSSGNVGIGTDGPDSLLHLKKTSADVKLTLETGESHDCYINFSGATSEAAIGYDATDNALLFCNPAGDLTTGEAMRINSSGNLLVGGTSVTSPSGAAGPLFLLEGSNPELIFRDDTGTANNMSMYYINDQLVWYSGSAENLRLTNSGNLTVAGALSKGSGSFRIDHPLPTKTSTHHLVHSFVEGPQADLIYRGKVTLVGGSATVNVDTAAGMTDGTFEVLCADVQCFTSNESGWTAVKGSVSGNTLNITAQDNTCTDTISWMVVGERQDQHMLDTEWTDENGKVIVEPLKES